MQIFKKKYVFIFLIIGTILFLGCREEEARVPIDALAVVNDEVFSKSGSMQFFLDGSGYLNGIHVPTPETIFKRTIVYYTGDWNIKKAIPDKIESFCIANTTTIGDRVDITATMSAVIFNFVGKKWYPSAGTVSFLVDDAQVGTLTFDEDSSDSQMILTGKKTECKVSLVLNAGGVCLSGFVITVPSYPPKSDEIGE